MNSFKNREVNSLFEDWLINPVESLDLEAKGWLDLDDIESKGTIAKALIALENHGGGYLVIGFAEDNSGVLSPDVNRPADLSKFSTDEINSIIKKYAEPPFHVHVSLQKHPETSEIFPVIRSPGTSKVPVRSFRQTPQGTLKENIYYIRRPGPASEAPSDGKEWDSLIRRCVLNQRTEIIEILQSFIPSVSSGNVKTIVDEQDTLNQFISDSFVKWSKINDGLEISHPAKITLGYFSFACQIIGKNKELSAREIVSAIGGLRRYTGWPIYVALHQENVRPSLKDGVIEASLIQIKNPSPAHADFWRINPKGYFYTLRGYQEDSLEVLAESRKARAAGTGIDLTVPTWRVAEFLLRTEELARFMFEDGFTMHIRCKWTGLKDRELFMFNPRRLIFDGHKCETSSVVTEEKFSQEVVQNLLPEAVKKLAAPLYEHFDFFELPAKFFEQEISLMRTGQMS